jgi:hypothetical protein
MLRELADMDISGRQVGRITERIGQELIVCREQPDFIDKTTASQTPPAAVIAVDGGRVQVRVDDSTPGVHEPHWRETKVGHLKILESAVSEKDPHPEVPSIFLNQKHVRALVNQLARNPRTEEVDASTKTLEPLKEKEPKPPKRMECLVKSCVASVCAAEAFVPLLRNEVRRLDLEKAERKLFIADGGAANWLIYEILCPHWDALLDFVHLTSHLFAVASCLYKKSSEAWLLYERLVTHAWKGEVEPLLDCLTQQQFRAGKLTKETAENAPARILGNTIKYISDNQKRMNYPKMRRLGLPVSSCNVESLIKQINQRVKASDKFWCVTNLEAVLQVRAAELSSNRWNLFWKLRSEAGYACKLAA